MLLRKGFLFGMMIMFLELDCSDDCEYTKIHPIVHFKKVNFITI